MSGCSTSVTSMSTQIEVHLRMRLACSSARLNFCLDFLANMQFSNFPQIIKKRSNCFKLLDLALKIQWLCLSSIVESQELLFQAEKSFEKSGYCKKCTFSILNLVLNLVLDLCDTLKASKMIQTTFFRQTWLKYIDSWNFNLFANLQRI